MTSAGPTFAGLWRELERIGRDPHTGGYRRYSWTPADTACRTWFTGQAERRGLAVETDNNGNLWAWWGPKKPGAIVTGSHLDSVPNGGAFDGPLGVVSALAAVDLLKDRSFSPERSVVLAALTEEEGARFGVPCLGSRLLTGAVDPNAARVLTDDAGTTLADAMVAAGHDPGFLGPRADLLGGIAAFVELHVEQGRALAPQGAVLGLAEGIWPHGRWRFEFGGRADHAGTARLTDRRDPMLPYAATALAARQAAEQNAAVATFGKVIVEPNGTNAVPSVVRAWLDARAADEATVGETVTTVRSAAERFCEQYGVTLSVRQESFTPLVRFDAALRDRIAAGTAFVPFGSTMTLPNVATAPACSAARRAASAVLAYGSIGSRRSASRAVPA